MLRAVPPQHRGGLAVVLLLRERQRRLPFAVGGDDVGALRDEGRHRVEVVVGGGDVERTPALGIRAR